MRGRRALGPPGAIPLSSPRPAHAPGARGIETFGCQLSSTVDVALQQFAQERRRYVCFIDRNDEQTCMCGVRVLEEVPGAPRVDGTAHATARSRQAAGRTGTHRALSHRALRGAQASPACGGRTRC